MIALVRFGQRARMLVGLLLLCAFSTPAAAAEDVWQATVGQNWFYESRGWADQQLAGTWWARALTPGNTYKISFEVEHVNGAVGLFVGNRGMVTVNRKGWHSYDFNIWQGGERRLIFTTLGRNVTAGIKKITVTPKWGGSGGSGGSDSGGTSNANANANNWMPKGHYLSINRERNLKREVLDVMDRPYTAKSNWHRGIARDLDRALKTPGVKGFSMRIDWRTLEQWDGGYDWKLMDANMAVARRYGLKFIVQVATRSFDGKNIMPHYFPGKYSVHTHGGGKSGYVAKLWEPWVYNRLIRLYKRIAQRYNNDPAFGGIATTETAIGNGTRAGYSYWKYRTALTRIATETQRALKRGRLFMYLNFLPGGDSSDMRRDGRVSLVKSVPQSALVIGAPDITPDRPGMPGSLNSYRIHLRKNKPGIEQFCHLQHADQGQGGVNKRTNRYRHEFQQRVGRVRNRERQSWFNGQRAIFEFDDIRLHPNSKLGKLWNPAELMRYANRNFDCDYMFWHYRENVHNLSREFWWEDIRPIIVNNQYFFR
jgi:hypothetical protein